MQFNFKTILHYAELSQLSYMSDKKILKKYPNAIIKEIPAYELKVFIVPAHDADTYWIACRGTANMSNAIQDIKYKKIVPDELGVPVHEGFYNSAVAVYNEIIGDIPDNTYKINLTGHSLGGAIAVILMMMLSLTRTINKCITLGQPKCVTMKGVKKFKDLPLLRIEDDEDPVPFLPPFTLYSLINFWPYRHFGCSIILGDNDSYEYLDEPQAESIWRSSFWFHIFREKIEEHYVSDYIKNIKQKVEV